MSTDDVVLTTEVSAHPAVFAAAFNSGDPDAVEQVYEPAGVLVSSPGAADGARRTDRGAAAAHL